MANAVRALSIDAIETAQSGHPGLPLGVADIATVLFRSFLKFDPNEPEWPDRDRFVLSAGHGSILLYALLHLVGYADMSLDCLKSFRKLHSQAPGHPEVRCTAGIETTTGPLGQGLATAVGMAIAEQHLASRFGETLVDHYTYVLVSDGDLMEGISHEAIALAGHLVLKKLIVLFDDNGISIDGPVSLSDSVDQCARFQACGWNVISINGHDPLRITYAIATARESGQPTLIACKTIIGYGAPKKQGTSSAHGSPLGPAEAKAAKAALGWPYAPFEIPDNIRNAWLRDGIRGIEDRKAWQERYARRDKATRDLFDRQMKGELPAELDDIISCYKKNLINIPESLSTREASGKFLDVVNPVLQEAIGGSADLTGSNKTKSKDMTVFSATHPSGRFIHYGIREHAMAAAMNGIALHRGLIPYSGTFLVFSDYCRPAIRLSALMKQRVIYVMTHDSIGLGEDGPTHQPVEQLASLRAIPNLLVMRPCDIVETAECWQIALHRMQGPSLIALSRQSLPQFRLETEEKNISARGGYVLKPATQDAQVTLISTGSEIQLAVRAQEILEAKGIATTVVSLPCWELFDTQPEIYRNFVISSATICIAIEAGSSMGWKRYTGDNGTVITLDTFGESAPYEDLYDHFHITPESIVSAAMCCLENKNERDLEKRGT
ncbi:MAG: transketolase [Alphaproteobacteria bacterium]|nr:transketolase [Alphaproteobacteria bacterium]